uniref:Carboxypeptidase O-like n=1 Tax=Mastacembelus armatus TaxID=205130 RepID=A0A3Q3LXW5_9TELE
DQKQMSLALLEYDYYKYHPMPEITNWMTQIAKDHPDVVTIVDYGQTYEKRTISLLKVIYIFYLKPKKKLSGWTVVYMQGISCMSSNIYKFSIVLSNQILQTYKTDPKMEKMMMNMDFYVTPVLNVDGYMYSWQDNTTRLWRKNMSPGPSGCDCNGTDINANFNANWGTIGISFDCCTVAFCGSSPISETETQAVTYFVGSRKEDFLCFLTIHSFSQMLLVPYGHPNFTAPNYNELIEVGLAAADEIKKVHGTHYTVGTPPDVLYANSGSSRDWARQQGIPFSYTFELRDNGTFGFELPEDQIKPSCEEAYEGALYIITYAHDKTFSGAMNTAATALWTMLLAVGVTTSTTLM